MYFFFFKQKTAYDGLTNPASLAANIPVEVAESEFPIFVERYGLVADSGGAGLYRGGLAIERSWRCLTPETSLIVRSDRAAHAPYGLQGGTPGSLSSNILVSPDGSERRLPSMFSMTIGEGDLYIHHTAGGGGWGNPLDRDPTDVADDVIDGKVSRQAALTEYGVILHDDLTVDVASTAKERDGRRN